MITGIPCQRCGIITEGPPIAWEDGKEYLVCSKCFMKIYPEQNTDYDDAYWLRYFAAAAMNGSLTRGFYDVKRFVEYASELLAEIKRVESDEK